MLGIRKVDKKYYEDAVPDDGCLDGMLTVLADRLQYLSGFRLHLSFNGLVKIDLYLLRFEGYQRKSAFGTQIMLDV